MYQGKINAHKKSEEMDIYLASNRIEQDLYKQENQKLIFPFSNEGSWKIFYFVFHYFIQ